MRKLILISLGLLAALTAFGQRTLHQWVTTADGASLYAPSADAVFSDERGDRSVPIIVDARQSYQEMLGFGFSLTGGSAELLMKMDASARTRILTELFGQDPGQLDISVVRLTVGASDMNSFVFSYDDMPEGKTDWDLKHFSLSQDLKDVVPVMQEIMSIHPDIWVMASPWSAPAWMKEEYDVRGPKLRRDCYDVYARYLAKYIVEMGKKGIRIDALTIQNEPLNSRNTPSMPWSPEDQKVFIRDYLGPQFDKQGIATDILLFDHNCDRPDYPLAILEDPKAASYAAGSAFHHYMGDLSAMTQMHEFRPDKDIYFTEQMVVDRSPPSGCWWTSRATGAGTSSCGTSPPTRRRIPTPGTAAARSASAPSPWTAAPSRATWPITWWPTPPRPFPPDPCGSIPRPRTTPPASSSRTSRRRA